MGKPRFQTGRTPTKQHLNSDELNYPHTVPEYPEKNPLVRCRDNPVDIKRKKEKKIRTFVSVPLQPKFSGSGKERETETETETIKKLILLPFYLKSYKSY